MAAKIEVVWGACVQDRMMHTLDLESLRIWGKFKDVVVHLEWESTNEWEPTNSYGGTTKHSVRLIVFVLHPQIFLFPWGMKHAATQDRLLLVANKLAKIDIIEELVTRYVVAVLNWPTNWANRPAVEN